MFWDVYTRLCAKDGKAPNVIAREVCGVKSTGTVTGWKNGATPRNNVLGQLSDYFGVSVDYLLTGESEQKEKPSTAGEIDLSGLSPEDAELVNLLLKAPEAKKNAIRALL
jgi:transcriptional regulator with XRE-family HTH domain